VGREGERERGREGERERDTKKFKTFFPRKIYS